MVDLGAATGFVAVFAIVGFFELFDRTSFALIAIASRARPFPTWAGGALAFVASTAIAVVVGVGFTDLLGPGHIGWLRVAGGGVLLAYAAWVYVQPAEEGERPRGPPGSAFLVAFATIFLLEMGDTTMIFEIVFIADWGWLVVLVAGASALVTVAAWDVALGRRLGLRVQPETLRRIVVVVLTIVGAATIAYGLAPSAFPSLGFAATG
ncbi:MAG TPA: TMEM165/GDT1 family protein [Thermoplasmata archaeon]|nr:TMEM165/GDT1 family protein [Thermoplasmata archaeon]